MPTPGNAVAMALGMLLAACTAAPDVARTADEVRAAVRRSGGGAPTLYAELSMGFRSPERDASTSAVLLYRAPDGFRLTAFVDLVLETRPVFDLLLCGERYAFLVHEDGAAAPRIEVGSSDGLAAHQPMLAGFHWTREGLFFPGTGVSVDARVAPGPPGQYSVQGLLSTGAHATWLVDGASLDVVRAHIEAPGEAFEVTYSDHDQASGRRLPRRVVLSDPRRQVEVTAVVSALELDAVHPAEAFDAPTQ